MKLPRPRCRPFLICALPRSRTAWLANFLTHGRVRCEHEFSGLASSPAEALAAVQALALSAPVETLYQGNADTAQVLILSQLLEALPSAALIVVRRPEVEVIESLLRLGLSAAEAAVQLLSGPLEAAARRKGAFVIEYRDLESESALRALQAHAAPGEPFDRERWQFLRNLQVQVTPERLRRLLAAEHGDYLPHTTLKEHY